MEQADPFLSKCSLRDLQAQLTKNPPTSCSYIRSEVLGHLQFAQLHGERIPEGSRVLDIGCGIGDAVHELVELGFDASGIDVQELWGKDFDQYWEDREMPRGEYLTRLHLVDVTNYKLPFPDGYFDFAISDQVFEHVFNYEEVFREVARVLKPGRISIHRFPGPNTFIEGHINVPIPLLCRLDAYLGIWAILGRRSIRQKGMSWKQAWIMNIETMKYAHYPTKLELRRRARAAGVRIEFADRTGIELRKEGRMAQLLDRVPSLIKKQVTGLLSIVAQRYMIIHGKVSA